MRLSEEGERHGGQALRLDASGYPKYVAPPTPALAKWVQRPLFFVPGCGNRTMNSEILAGLDFFERDKGIKREVLLEAINNAVLAAARKAVGPAKDLRVEI